MEMPHIKISVINGAFLRYMPNKRAILGNYIRKISGHSFGRLSAS
jgi:hypothetical protein